MAESHTGSTWRTEESKPILQITVHCSQPLYHASSQEELWLRGRVSALHAESPSQDQSPVKNQVVSDGKDLSLPQTLEGPPVML